MEELKLSFASVLFLTAFFAALALTPVCWFILRKLGFWNARDGKHVTRIVRGCGISIAISAVVVGLIFNGWDSSSFWVGIIPAVFVLAVAGLFDDRFGLHPMFKLFLHVSSIVLLWIFGFRIESFLGYEFPVWLSLLSTCFWGVAILNAFNLIDGLDGLCTGNALIASVVFLITSYLIGSKEVFTGAAILSGCCAGFLIFNFNPAKLFLGDTGSLFLGLFCTALSLKFTNGAFNLPNFVLLLLVFWIPFCDEGLAIWRRKVKTLLKRHTYEITERDELHIHYRLLNEVKNHRLTVLILYAGMMTYDAVAITIFCIDKTWVTILLFVITSLVSLIILARYEIEYTFCLAKYTYRHIQTKVNNSQNNNTTCATYDGFEPDDAPHSNHTGGTEE